MFDPAIGELYREMQPQLLRYAEGILGSRPDAEEAVQDAFLAASRAGRLDDPRPWLFRVTRNAAIDQLRRRRHLSLLDPDGLESLASTVADPHRSAELSDDLRTLRMGLDRLPEQQRSALVLRELPGLGYREIAVVLEVSEANVKVLIFRARQSLQQFALASRLPCDAAQLALSARADGEAGRAEAARARLHAVTCARCREFSGAVRGQRIELGLLVPVAGGHGVASAAVHAVVGAKAGGGLGGLLGLKTAAAAAAAAVVVSTGAAVAVHEGVGSHPGGHGRPPAAPLRSTRAVVPAHTPRGGEVSDERGGHEAATGTGSGEDGGSTATDGGSSGSDPASGSGDGGDGSSVPDGSASSSTSGGDGDGGGETSREGGG